VVVPREEGARRRVEEPHEAEEAEGKKAQGKGGGSVDVVAEHGEEGCKRRALPCCTLTSNRRKAMSSTEPLVVVKGFTRPGLVRRLGMSFWSKGQTRGVRFENFDGLALGYIRITRPGDRFSPLPIKVVVTEGGETFSISGFVFTDVVRAVHIGPVKILGNPLQPQLIDREHVEYTIRIFPDPPEKS
jgi:hypothetical protein